MKKIEKLNSWVWIILGLAALVLVYMLFIKPVQATVIQTPDNCNEVFTYTKSADFDDSRLNINFESNDNQIDVAAKAGYEITEVALEIADDGHSGFHVYATGAVNNFNPNPGSDIQVAKVKVKKVCVASPTPSASPSASPSLSPSPSASASATPAPTEGPKGFTNDGGDGRGCAVNDCSGNASKQSNGEVLGITVPSGPPATGRAE